MCVFCKIGSHEISAKVVLENERLIAFHDLNPAAPTHVLVIPKKHIAALSAASADDAALLGELMLAASEVAEKTGLVASGYRTVVNTGAHAGQSVFHLHVHVLGGRAMAWPPG